MKITPPKLVSVTVVAVVLAVYWVSGPQTLPGADAGEFAAIAFDGGIAHPPGYPLLSFVLRLFALLGGVFGPIRALSLCSMLCGAFAALMIYYTCLRVFPVPGAAATATLTIFFSVDVWRANTTIEPFAMNLLHAAMLLWAFVGFVCCDKFTQKRSLYGLVMGVASGMGVANHHSLMMMLPLPAIALSTCGRKILRPLSWMAMGVIAGVIPIAYFFLPISDGAPVWGDWSNPLARLIDHLTRAEYGSISLMKDARGSWSTGPALFFGGLPAALSYGFVLISVVGATWLGRQSRRERSLKLILFGVLLCFGTTSIVLPALFKIPPTPFNIYIARRFFALPMLLLALPLHVGIAFLTQRIVKAVGAIAQTALLAIHIAGQWPTASRIDDRFYETHMENVYRIIEDDAVIIAPTDMDYSMAHYARAVLNHRRVSVFVPNFLQYSWYPRALAREIDAAKPLHDIESIISGIISKRPVYLLDPLVSKNLGRYGKFLYPVGPCWRIVENPSDLPDPIAIYQLNRRIYDNILTLPSPNEVARASAWVSLVIRRYVAVWRGIESALFQNGHIDLSRQAGDRARHLESAAQDARHPIGLIR